MASFLQRVGRASFHRRRLVLGTWVSLLLALAATALLAGGSFSTNFSIPGTESQKAIDLLGEKVPAAKGATGRVVFAAPDGERLTGQTRSAVTSTLADIGNGPGVAQVSDPFTTGTVSKDGRIAYAQITFAQPVAELTAEQREAVAATAMNRPTQALSTRRRRRKDARPTRWRKEAMAPP